MKILINTALTLMGAVLILALIFLSSPYITFKTERKESYGLNGEIYISGGIDIPFYGVKGEACEIKGETVESVIKKFKAKVVFTESIDGGISYYCLAKKSPYYAKIKGKKINLHIYRKGDKIKIGVPVIYGGY